MFEVKYSLDEYLEELEQEKPERVDVKLQLDDKDRLHILDNSCRIERQAIVINNELFFPHYLLRRSDSKNFDDFLLNLGDFLNRGSQVKLRFDPFEKRDMSDLDDILEHDRWFGPEFSNGILKNKQDLSLTIHTTEDEKQFMDYPVKYTIFRPSWLDKDKNIIQYYIEELLLPKDEEKDFPLCRVPYCSNKFVAQKFVHFTYDRNNNCFEHIDGSVRVFKMEQFKKIYNEVQSGKVYNQHIDGVERYKLFKVKGNLSFEDVSQLLKSFLRGNPHISEYFDSDKVSR